MPWRWWRLLVQLDDAPQVLQKIVAWNWGRIKLGNNSSLDKDRLPFIILFLVIGPLLLCYGNGRVHSLVWNFCLCHRSSILWTISGFEIFLFSLLTNILPCKSATTHKTVQNNFEITMASIKLDLWSLLGVNMGLAGGDTLDRCHILHVPSMCTLLLVVYQETGKTTTW
jgi:uncharacterized membrane protein YbjE (DUF340 family)